MNESALITTALEYEKAQAEIQGLTDHLARLQQTSPAGSKGFTKAGVGKMIPRLHEEVAVCGCATSSYPKEAVGTTTAQTAGCPHEIPRIYEETRRAIHTKPHP